MKDFNELKTIIQTKGGSKGSDGKELYKLFGQTKLAKCFDVKRLDEMATQMLADCKIWMENWTTIQEGVKPELERIRKNQLAEELEALKGKYSPDELKALVAQLAA